MEERKETTFNNTNVELIKTALSNLEGKNNKIYFFCMDSKGVAMASIATIYEHAKILIELGYNAIILTEKADYTRPDTWLGEGYEEIPHETAGGEEKDGGAVIGPQDFIIIPEVYGGILPQLSEANCEKIIFVQSYDYIFELMKPGETWGPHGVRKCITTTTSQENYIKGMFPNIQTSVIQPHIPEYFNSQVNLKKPFVAILSRDPRDTSNFIKSFYVKHPFLKWITFRDMRGMSRKEFADGLDECAIAVWVDSISSFGTFPIECMKSKVPVVGLVPDLTPEWLTEQNGIWTNNKLTLVDTTAGVMKNWLEDSIPQELYDEMEKTVALYSTSIEAEQVALYYKNLFEERVEDLVKVLNKEITAMEENHPETAETVENK